MSHRENECLTSDTGGRTWKKEYLTSKTESATSRAADRVASSSDSLGSIARILSSSFTEYKKLRLESAKLVDSFRTQCFCWESWVDRFQLV